MTGRWQDPKMGAAYHAIYGGSEKHDAVPELFEAGYRRGAVDALNEAADGMDAEFAAKRILGMRTPDWLRARAKSTRGEPE